jgi:hypothetical protein
VLAALAIAAGSGHGSAQPYPTPAPPTCGLMSLNASMTTLPFTLCTGSITTDTARWLSASKDCGRLQDGTAARASGLFGWGGGVQLEGMGAWNALIHCGSVMWGSQSMALPVRTLLTGCRAVASCNPSAQNGQLAVHHPLETLHFLHPAAAVLQTLAVTRCLSCTQLLAPSNTTYHCCHARCRLCCHLRHIDSCTQLLHQCRPCCRLCAPAVC